MTRGSNEMSDDMNDLIAEARRAEEFARANRYGQRSHSELIARLADALEAATREPSGDGEYLLSVIETIKQTGGSVEIHGVKIMPCDEFGRTAAIPDAATELAAIKARTEEVGEDEGWHIGGAWGDYGEVVVPLRILSYVIDGALDEKVVSTDPGYAATYAEQVARAERAEAERDAAVAALERVRAILDRDDFGDDWEHDEWVYREAAEKKLGEIEAALDGAPEPEETGLEYRARTDYGRVVAQGSLDEIGHLSGHIWERRRPAGPWEVFND